MPMCAKRAIPLYLMAKAPRAGRVKTRMHGALGEVRAAQLAQQMLLHSAHTAQRHWRGEVVLCVWPDDAHAAFRHLRRHARLRIVRQRGADLGARMHHALTEGIARAGCAAVIGCDVPHCRGAILHKAHALLMRGRNPIGAAQDGGFYLLGLHAAPASLFADIAWGGAQVCAALRARAMRAGIELAELPKLRDIDSFDDLKWLAARDRAYRRFV